MPTGETIPAAAAPLAISMTGENGRGSTVGEPERTAQLYDTLTRQLGEALGIPGALGVADARQGPDAQRRRQQQR